MRKFLIIALILGFVLSGCTTMDPDHDTTNTLDSHLSEPSEDWSSQTDPTESLEGTASGPVASEPTLPTPTVPDPSENSTDETQSPQQATETPTTLTEPTEVTKPTQTLPPETTPTQLAEPWIEETGQPVEIVDASQIAAEANSYAVSLGFVVDNSLNKGNSGYYSPDYRPIVTNEIGTAAARDLVSATKNQLNSRFSESYSPTLLESIFGLVRVNCVVEYSHTVELGD